MRMCKTTSEMMEEQAQSLTDKTTVAFQQGKIPPTPAGAMILTFS